MQLQDCVAMRGYTQNKSIMRMPLGMDVVFIGLCSDSSLRVFIGRRTQSARQWVVEGWNGRIKDSCATQSSLNHLWPFGNLIKWVECDILNQPLPTNPSRPLIWSSRLAFFPFPSDTPQCCLSLTGEKSLSWLASRLLSASRRRWSCRTPPVVGLKYVRKFSKYKGRK